MLHVTVIISLLGISFEGKQLGTHVYTDWNKTTVKNKFVTAIVLLGGLLPTYFFKKSVRAARVTLGISEVFEQ